MKAPCTLPPSLTESFVSLFPPGRRFIRAFRGLQLAVKQLQKEARSNPCSSDVDADTVDQNTDVSELITAREIQRAAAAHLPLQVGELFVREGSVEVAGIMIAPDGLTQNMAFFINGQKCDDVTYPIADQRTEERFALTGHHGAAFRARITKDLETLERADFFRIDASPTGTYVPSRWRHAIWFMNPDKEAFPMPPVANIQRVVGDDSVSRFGMGGATIFHNISNFLRESDRDWKDFPNILDWGCGAGRLTRYLMAGTESDVYGLDIDEDNVNWCSKNLSGAYFIHAPLKPPTSLPDGLFNLVVGTSVVTHLTEEMQFAWLQELHRVTRPGALLFLSVTGQAQIGHLGLSTAIYQKAQKAGFLDLSVDHALDGYIEDSNYYRSTWHSRPYIIEKWGQYFDVLAILDGIAALQDFVVLRRRD